MSVIRVGALVVFVTCMGLTIGRLTVDGITVIAAVMVLVIMWTYGAFSRGFWIGTDEENAEYARIDQELDRHNRGEWAAARAMWDREDGAR